MMKLKTSLAIALGAFLALFALQNMAQVEITLLLWSFESRRILVIALCVLIGFALGWIAKSHTKQRKRHED